MWLYGAQKKLFQIVMGSVKTNTNNPDFGFYKKILWVILIINFHFSDKNRQKKSLISSDNQQFGEKRKFVQLEFSSFHSLFGEPIISFKTEKK